MRFNVVTLFPEMITELLKAGVVGQAATKGEIEVQTINPRQFTSDVHHSVDDRPYGGGDGMVMLYAPLNKALESIGEKKGLVVLLSAHGRQWTDKIARIWAESREPVTLICGRYAGVDQRFINEHVDLEISLGDYILSGGELGALVLIDSVTRLLPNVLGNAVSANEDSFSEDGLLEAPLFTRPREITGLDAVPVIFLSGDHAKIKSARRALSLAVTQLRRPDLMTQAHILELKNAKPLLNQFSRDDLKACGLDLLNVWDGT